MKSRLTGGVCGQLLLLSARWLVSVLLRITIGPAFYWRFCQVGAAKLRHGMRWLSRRRRLESTLYDCVIVRFATAHDFLFCEFASIRLAARQEKYLITNCTINLFARVNGLSEP